MSDIAIKVENLSKQYRLGTVGTGTISHDLNRWWARVRGKEDPYLKIGETNDRRAKGDSEYVWSLKGINFEVKKGEVLGIIGKNGAGKSTLLKILSKVTGPTTGRITAKGRIGALLEVGTGFHPELTGRENIFLNGAILGMTKIEIKNKLDEIIDFSGCARFVDTPVKRYSSGMRVRLAFAVAAFLEPEILIVDEVLAVGDFEFQKKAIGKMQDVSKNDGRTVLFVSHNMNAIQSLCNRVMVLNNGKVDTIDAVQDAILRYREGILSSKTNYYFNNLENNLSRIEKVILEDSKGNENGIFSFGAELIIHIVLKVLDPLRSPLISVRLSNSSNINVVNFKSSEAIVNPFAKGLSPGINSIKVRIKDLYLLNDFYHVSIGFADGKEIFTVLKEELSFQVFPELYKNSPNLITKENSTHSILFHEATWELH